MDQKPSARPGSLEVVNDASITWRYFAPSGITLADVQRPDYWRNVLREVGQQRIVGRNAWNKIEILAEDGSWEAELRILSVADGLVQTRVIREWSQPAKPGRKPGAPEGYVIEHIPNNGWRVLDPNGQPVASKLSNEEDANRAAASHSKKAAA